MTDNNDFDYEINDDKDEFSEIPGLNNEEENEEEAGIEDEDIENSAEILEKTLQQNKDKPENKNKIVMKDFFEDTKKDYEEFEKRARNKGKGYKIPDYPFIEEKLEGLDEGLYVFAGESNSGKSATMLNIIKSVCSCRENHLFGLYFSLDDTKQVIIPRVIAMEQLIPISVASKPKRWENMLNDLDNEQIAIYEDYLEKRKAGLQKLIDEVDIFKIVDSEDIKNQKDLFDYVDKIETFLKKIDERYNLIIAIDSIKDIQLDFKTNSDNEKSETIARMIKQLAVTHHIPVFVSCHMRKLNGNRRPTLDDLKDANTLVYESSLVWLIHNDLSKNKGATNIYWNDEQAEDGKGAIIELDWAKNKVSSYKGRSFLKFQTYYSKTTECSKEDNNRYEAIIYQS